ncbi:hypothetical protein PI87_16525 [Ralstonia sp. A12]|uniref:hypothetical protein n=1 Tax=Ralstonia sp. A12 TaxID=1217052 RepID=UPI0005751632|nr:hypothetical protein [Ralstonia sp. A12]KHK54119.1 hypothetical protein PI87_16525 [Ralstonia sp. A12]
MNDYWLYLSKSEMVIGRARGRRREATVLDTAECRMEGLAEFVGQRVPRGKRLSVWLSGGYCHYVTFARPWWVFAPGKLRTIAAKVFEQKTLLSASDYAFSLKPSRSSLHVCGIRQADMSQILRAVGDRYAVHTISPLAPAVFEAYKRAARGATLALYEPDSLTVAQPSKEAGLLLATTAGASHASVLTRMLAAHGDTPAEIEVISVSSVQAGLSEAQTPGLILNGWLKRQERLQQHG